MSQSRLGSAIESAVNIAVGFWVAIATQALVFPLFDIQIHFHENLAIAGLFTITSLIRSYLLRRLFNWVSNRDQSVDRTKTREG